MHYRHIILTILAIPTIIGLGFLTIGLHLYGYPILAILGFMTMIGTLILVHDLKNY
jgi:hypothetical protein